MTIVAILEFRDGGANRIHVLEDTSVDGLRLQGPVEALGEALVCGSATMAKLGATPQNLIWLRKSSAVYCAP